MSPHVTRLKMSVVYERTHKMIWLVVVVRELIMRRHKQLSTNIARCHDDRPLCFGRSPTWLAGRRGRVARHVALNLHKSQDTTAHYDNTHGTPRTISNLVGAAIFQVKIPTIREECTKSSTGGI